MADTRLEHRGARAAGGAAQRSGVGHRGALARGDRRALLVLVALPVLLQVPFSLVGHPLLQGDNLTQNFPLRVLAGEQLRAGHLPAWNALIWSGTPLLAGWNAGAMFPGTWLFALLPHLAAWTLNELFAPIAGGVGTYLLLRRLSCGPLAGLIGALAFAWTGFMAGQAVHLGLVQGTALLPWTLLGIESVAQVAGAGHGWRRFVPGVLEIGVSLALTVLAGDPRAVSSAAIVAVVYGLAHVVRAGWQVRRVLAPIAGGALLALACSAIQWWPGIAFLRGSQRGATGFAAYSAGSLTLSHLLMYLALPFADGGNGNWSTPVYGGNYNLPEITVGVGVLALVAFFAFLPELCGDLHSWWRRRRHEAAPAPGGHRRLGVWYVLIGLGVLLSLGGTTPLGHLFVHLPLFGGERLQNRNALLVDLGLVVLLAFLIDDVAGAVNAADGAAPAGALGTRASRRVALVPVVGVVGFAVFNVAFPTAAGAAWGNTNSSGTHPGANAPYWIVTALALAGVAAVVVFQHRMGGHRRRLVLGATALLEIAVFIASANYATAPSSVLGGPTVQSAVIRSLAGPLGRFALYNPLQNNPTSDHQFLRRLGVPDINILQNSPSVQGYGSIVDSTYAAATASHTYQDLDVGRLSGETFNTLDLSVFITPPAYLYTVLANRAPIPLGRGEGVTYGGTQVSGPGVPSAASLAAGPFAVGARSGAVFELGAPQQVIRADIVIQPGTQAPARLAVALSSPDGRLTARRWVRVVAGQARLVLPRAVEATTMRIENDTARASTIGAVVVTTRKPALRLLLDGHLQGLLLPPHWRYLSRVGPFLAYRNTETRGLAWLQRPGQRTPEVFDRAPGHVTTTVGSLLRSETMVVDTPKPALLVRSVTFEPGWSARLTPLGGGPSRTLPAHRFGLVQVVDLPAGNFRVEWRYAPRSLERGMLVSIAGTVVVVALALVGLDGRRRRVGASRVKGTATSR